MKRILLFALSGLLLIQAPTASAISRKQLKRLAGTAVITAVLGYLTYRCFYQTKYCFSKSSELSTQAENLHKTLLPEAKEKCQNLLNSLIEKENTWLKKHCYLDGFNQKTETKLLHSQLADLQHKLKYSLPLSPEEDALRGSCANYGQGGIALSNLLLWLGGGTLMTLDQLCNQLYKVVFGQKQSQISEEIS